MKKSPLPTLYCTIVREQIIASKGYGERVRDSVNFRKFSPCIARARRARAGLTVYSPMRDFASLIVILGNYCTFVCGSLFRGIRLVELQRCNTYRVLEKRSRGICSRTMVEYPSTRVCMVVHTQLYGMYCIVHAAIVK
jgi:hypothetical protein